MRRVGPAGVAVMAGGVPSLAEQVEHAPDPIITLAYAPSEIHAA